MIGWSAVALPQEWTPEESNSQSCRSQTTCCLARPGGCLGSTSRTHRDACNADSLAVVLVTS